MPLRDHFRPPLDNITSWKEGFYGGWPPMIVVALSKQLPIHYAAAPRVHYGKYDSTATAPDTPDLDAFEVCIYHREREQRLVAAIEIVSPANKDRREHRNAFVAKCAALLQNQVSVTIVDLVTTRDFNLYGDLLELLGHTDPTLEPEPPPLYAVSCRTAKKDDGWLLETWMHALKLGQPLPTLPLWLADNLAIPLELEACYEETCQILRIP